MQSHEWGHEVPQKLDALIEKLPALKMAWYAAGREVNETFYELAIEALGYSVESLTAQLQLALERSPPQPLQVQLTMEEMTQWHFLGTHPTPTANELIVWIHSMLTPEEKQLWSERAHDELLRIKSYTLKVALHTFRTAIADL
jgi:hypothetical protein